MARKHTIMSLFGTSPIRPLQQHMTKVVDCVEQLTPFFEAVLAEDFVQADVAQERIAALENEADDLKHQLRLNLPRTLFLPVERRDLLEVLTMQDNIANCAKDIAGLIRGRRMVLPAPVGERYLEFIARSIDACRQAQRAVNELDELLETGFRGNEVKLVQKMMGLRGSVWVDIGIFG